MPFRYKAYGLIIQSALELPELVACVDWLGEPDIIIRLGESAIPDDADSSLRNEARWTDSQNFRLKVDAAAEYLVSRGREITVTVDRDADAATVRAYLLGSACGAILLQRGFLVLHGNAIRVGNACLVCVGDSGAGKSTLAAGFLKRGFQVLADDVVAVDGQGCAIPGFPRVKLWQDAADQLGFSTEGLLRVAGGLDKFNLPISPFDHEARLPIRWIYRLTTGEVDDIAIEPMTGLSRFRLLRDNTYRNEYLEGSELLAGHLHQCSRLAGSARLATVVRPCSGFALDSLIDRLLADALSPSQGS